MQFSRPWFALAPSELPATRLSLDFGLRSDHRMYRELVVPRAGRVQFVRQLSWAVGALALVPLLQDAGLARLPSRAATAHAIEALGSKLAFAQARASDDPRRGRIIGIRAFERDHALERMAFTHLSGSENYVQNTHRQTVVRALRSDDGLSLTVGRRYAEMLPAGLGIDLAEAFLSQRVGRGGRRLDARLVEWIRESYAADGHTDLPGESLREALSPLSPTEEERRLVATMLFRGSEPQAVTRDVLAKIIRKFKALPSIEAMIVPALRAAGREQQARDLEAARAFGAMLDSIIAVARSTASPIRQASGRLPIARLVVDSKVRDELEQLGERAGRYAEAGKAADTHARAPTAFKLSTDVAQLPRAGVLAEILRRAPDIFDVDGTTVGPGDLLPRLAHEITAADRDDELDVAADALTDRTFQLDGFHSLVRDCRQTSEAQS